MSKSKIKTTVKVLMFFYTLFLFTSNVFAEELVPFKEKKVAARAFFLTLYAVNEYEYKAKKNILKQTINCISNATNKNELQECINAYKKAMQELGKNVKLYSQRFLEETLKDLKRRKAE